MAYKVSILSMAQGCLSNTGFFLLAILGYFVVGGRSKSCFTHSKFWNGVYRKCASLAVYKHINYYEIGGNGFKTFPPIQPLAQPYFIVN